MLSAPQQLHDQWCSRSTWRAWPGKTMFACLLFFLRPLARMACRTLCCMLAALHAASWTPCSSTWTYWPRCHLHASLGLHPGRKLAAQRRHVRVLAARDVPLRWTVT